MKIRSNVECLNTDT